MRTMKKVLITWIGATDLRASQENGSDGLGPIAQAVEVRDFDEAVLVSDYPKTKVETFSTWLSGRNETPLTISYEKLSSPTDFGDIYRAAVKTCERVLGESPAETALTFHLSPGTPAMAAVWILLAKTRFPAELIESSREHGVKTAAVPFEISVDFIPDLLKEKDERLRLLSGELPPESPEFSDIIHRSRVMSRLIERARRVAVRNIPVLIEGESGTGKELLARAIHRASLRKDAPFIAVNCGAIPDELIESELFGHKKGAFTGATESREGYFEAANGGTLFLDELGELPGPAQVKLLRVLQEGEISRLGTTQTVKVDVRIIAATNRTLTEEISAGRFREDLFYRLAVAVLNIPPLRDRSGDLNILIDYLINEVNMESETEPGFEYKKLSAGARNLLLAHPWPGNVRELLNTLRRAAIWSNGPTITVEDIRDALLPSSVTGKQDVLNRPLGGGFNLPDLLENVAKHYLSRALEEAGGNKTKAAELAGLPSYQTLTNWLNKYGMKN